MSIGMHPLARTCQALLTLLTFTHCTGETPISTVPLCGAEVPYDGIDQDCDGADLTDVDGDGFAALLVGGTDCDDAENARFPGASELCNGYDDNCDTLRDNLPDLDGDGFVPCGAAFDCAELDPHIFPGAPDESCKDGIDADCDKRDDCLTSLSLNRASVRFYGEDEFEQLGGPILPAGDLNGDTYPDLLLRSDDGVYVVFGPLTPRQYQTGELELLLSNRSGALDGAGLWTLHDFNGDGSDDFLLSRTSANEGAGQLDVYLSPHAWGGLRPTFSLRGLPDEGMLGCYNIPGDFNADGLADLVVSACGETRRAVYLIYGQALAPVGVQQVDALASVVIRATGESEFGRATAAGDFNGDGALDIVISGMASTTDWTKAFARIRLFLGPLEAREYEASEASCVISSEAAYGNHSMAGIGNVDGDTHDGHPVEDILLGFPLEADGSGGGYVLRGRDIWPPELSLEEQSLFLFSEGYQGRIGSAISDAGDINADGLADYLLGSPYYIVDERGVGGAFLMLGQKDLAAQLGTSLSLEEHATALYTGAGVDNPKAATNVGYSPDLNDDGIGELLIGAAFTTEDHVQQGAAYILFGGEDGL